jgi:hypothetical protein
MVQEETEELGVDLLAFITPNGRRGIRPFGVVRRSADTGITELGKEARRPFRSGTGQREPTPISISDFDPGINEKPR